jgi:hypothetical protein
MATSSSGWLYPTDSGDYGTPGGGYLWYDPLLKMDLLGLDPDNPDDVDRATELVAEATMIIDGYTDHRFGPARCLATTFRVRAFPILKMNPPVGTVHAVVLHHDKCLPPDDIYMPDLDDDDATPGLQMAQQRAVVQSLLGQGSVLPSPLAVIPGEGGAASSTSGYSYCVDSPTTIRMCGMRMGGGYTGSWTDGYWGGYTCAAGGGCMQSELITVLYRSRANWPPGMTRIFDTVLVDLSQDEGSQCRVPQGATSVNRQGVSWSLEESDKLTGIPSVDRWIMRHGSKVRLNDPMNASLMFSRFYDCAAVAPYGAMYPTPFAAEFAASVDDAATIDPLTLPPAPTRRLTGIVRRQS